MDGLLKEPPTGSATTRPFSGSSFVDFPLLRSHNHRTRLPRQSTLGREVQLTGIGLHSGCIAETRLLPAPANIGIVFRRVDLSPMVEIECRHDRVVDTQLCTALAARRNSTARIRTVEHLMAALYASGIDNAFVEVNADELPILDGSSAPWLALLDRAGVLRQRPAARVIEVLRPVTVRRGESAASLHPVPPSLSMGDLSLDVAIDFEAGAIGRQRLLVERVDRSSFDVELADCRTFALADEISSLRALGLARGGSLENAVVVDGAVVLNPQGLRRPDEFVRHKALDVVGDLALAGARLHGRYVGVRPGHGLNSALLHALFADRANWRWAEQSSAVVRSV